MIATPSLTTTGALAQVPEYLTRAPKIVVVLKGSGKTSATVAPSRTSAEVVQ